MATITLELFTSKKLKKEQDRHPLYLIVRKDWLSRRRYVGAAFKDEWDEVNKKVKPKGRKDYVEANIHIEDEFAKYKTRFKELERSVLPWEADDIFNTTTVALSGPVTFYQFADEYMNILEQRWVYLRWNFLRP